MPVPPPLRLGRALGSAVVDGVGEFCVKSVIVWFGCFQVETNFYQTGFHARNISGKNHLGDAAEEPLLRITQDARRPLILLKSGPSG